MGKKGKSLKTKRSEVPAFWKISKKNKVFVVRTQPGPHAKTSSYPILVLLRDILGIVKNNKVASQALNDGDILVDGKVIRSPGFPVGLMDVIEIPKVGKSFRMVPLKGGLEPVEIPNGEKGLKLCVVKSKTTLQGSRTVCGLHDGRVIMPVDEVDLIPGDSCLLGVPNQKFHASFRLAKGSQALLTRGERSGEIVSVEDLKPGTFSRGPIASIRMSDGTSSELPTGALMPLGKQAPQITVTKGVVS